MSAMSSSTSLAYATSSTTCTYNTGAVSNQTPQEAAASHTPTAQSTGIWSTPTQQTPGSTGAVSATPSTGMPTHTPGSAGVPQSSNFEIKDSIHYDGRGHMHVDVQGYGQGILRQVDSISGMAKVSLRYGGTLSVNMRKVSMHSGHNVFSSVFGVAGTATHQPQTCPTPPTSCGPSSDSETAAGGMDCDMGGSENAIPGQTQVGTSGINGVAQPIAFRNHMKTVKRGRHREEGEEDANVEYHRHFTSRPQMI